MRIVIVSLSAGTALIGALWFAFGGETLLIGLAVISTICLIISCFTLGVWYAHKSIQLGARIATEAVSNNDKWDTAKMQSLARFGGEIFKLKGGVTETNGYPPLLESGDDFNFLISGLDE